MAEYIDRSELSITPIDITDLPTDKCLMVYLAEDVDSLPTADVVSHGVYEQVAWERDTAIEQLKELGFGFGEKTEPVVRRSKIDKAIEEIQEFEMSHCINVMDWEDIIPECLKIIKENIGE